MRLPSLNRYIDVMQEPHHYFRTLRGVEVCCDAGGEPLVWTGNTAAIFKIMVDGRATMLRCMTKQSSRCEEIYSYLGSIASPLAGQVRLLMGELFVPDYESSGEYVDVVVAPWIEGMTLNGAIAMAAAKGDKEQMGRLADSFTALALSLLSQPWAHGDLKPDNIIVDPQGALHLIDFDALYLPQSNHRTAIEVGTKPFQHPLRNATHYDQYLDHYPIALIAASLDLLGEDTSLYDPKSEGLIFDPQAIVDQSDKRYFELMERAAKDASLGRYRLLSALQSPQHKIDKLEQILRQPHFDDIEDEHDGLRVASLGSARHIVDCSGHITTTPWQRINNFSQGVAAVALNSKWGYIDTQGRVVIEPQFDSASSFRDGLAVVRAGQKYGYIDLRAGWVIDPIYDYATPFANGRAEVELDKKVIIIDKIGSIIG